MIFSNFVIALIECWICLTAVIGRHGQVTCFDGGGDSDFDSGTYLRLDNELKEIMRGSTWQTAESRSDGTLREDAATVVTQTTVSKGAWTIITGINNIQRNTVQTRRLKLIDGLFSSNTQREAARKKSSPKVCRSKDTATREKSTRIDKGGEAATDNDTAIETTTSGPPNRTVFDNEDECMAASGGRSCVCYLTDFLDLIDQRLDDPATTADEDTIAPAFKCPSYKPVPAAFVVSSKAAATSHEETTTVKVSMNKNNSVDYVDGQAVTSPARREVNFDSVVNYRLQTFKDGW